MNLYDLFRTFFLFILLKLIYKHGDEEFEKGSRLFCTELPLPQFRFALRKCSHSFTVDRSQTSLHYSPFAFERSHSEPFWHRSILDQSNSLHLPTPKILLRPPPPQKTGSPSRLLPRFAPVNDMSLWCVSQSVCGYEHGLLRSFFRGTQTSFKVFKKFRLEKTVAVSAKKASCRNW